MKYLRTALLASICMLLNAGTALAGQMQPLDSLPDRAMEAWWINDGGTIAGTAYGDAGALPVRWVEGELEVLDGPLVLADGVACDIFYGDSRMVDNDGFSVALTAAACAVDEVVIRASWWDDESAVWRPFPLPEGASETFFPYVNHGGDVAMASDVGLFIFSDGEFMELPPLRNDDESCSIFAMNNRGMVTGQCFGSDDIERAVVWVDGTARELLGLGGDSSYGRAINERGDIVGFSGQNENEPVRFPGASVLWPARSVETPVVIHEPGAANAINNRGMIAGFTGVNGDQNTRATLWSRGRAEDLGTLGGPFSIARSINERGVVVGSSVNADGQLVGFIYDPRQR